MGTEQGDGSSGSSPWLHQIERTLVPGCSRTRLQGGAEDLPAPLFCLTQPLTCRSLVLLCTRRAAQHREVTGRKIPPVPRQLSSGTAGYWHSYRHLSQVCSQIAHFRRLCFKEDGSFPGDAVFLKKTASASSNPVRYLSWTEKRFFIPHPCSENGLSPRTCKNITEPHRGAGYPCSPRNSRFFPEG